MLTKCSETNEQIRRWQQEFSDWLDAPSNHNGQLIQSDDTGLTKIWQPPRGRLKILVSGGVAALDPGHASTESLLSVVNRELRALGLPARLELRYSPREIFDKTDTGYDANIAYLTEAELINRVHPAAERPEIPFWQLPGFQRWFNLTTSDGAPHKQIQIGANRARQIQSSMDQMLSEDINPWLFIAPATGGTASQLDPVLFEHSRIVQLVFSDEPSADNCLLSRDDQAHISLQITKAIGVSLARKLGH